MSFLYPSFLFGLFAVAIPIAIHLFNFRRTRKVYFTNVAFLKEVKTSTNSFRRLKQWLILATRILFITFLVLAFAQPFIQSPKQQSLSSQGNTGIYLDNSLSMQNETGKRQYLQLATDEADELLGALPKTPSIQLLTNDFESRDQYLATPDKLKDRLTEINFSPTSRTLESIYKRQNNLLSRNSPSTQNQFIWFSDFQKSTVGDLNKLKIDTNSRIFLVPVQTEETANLYVDSVWLATPFVKEMETNTLNVRLVNTGKDAVKNLPVKLFLDEKQVSSSSVNLDANNSVVAAFDFLVKERGLKKGRISFEDFPVTFDNDFYFVLNASPTINIVHMFGGATGNYIQNLFSNETIFQARSLNAQNVDPTLLNTADLAILDGVTDLSGSLPTSLEAFVKKGGSLIIFPGPANNSTIYGSLLSRLGVPSPQNTTSPDKTFEAIDAPDTRNPFFESIFENTTQKERMAMPAANPVWQWTGRGSSLLRLKTGTPFLSRFDVQRGKVYLCASPLTDNFSTFQKHALFVPILYKIAALSKSQERLSFSFQEPSIVVEINEAGKEPVFHLKRDNLELIPSQRISGKQLLFDIPENSQTGSKQLAEAGYYELTLNGKVQKILAFNYDKKESQPDSYSPTELKQIFGRYKNVQIFSALNEGEFVNEFKSESQGKNFWKYCLIAALFFLLAEILIIRFVKG
ncbi:BatA domain-containing protein [Xanthocytophaga agilis]|uniref:BatA domain-containing protein n=1 Tax=Xanthocytophaga agilis TaxID=3048010 RepID=A0AAE3QX30_9BACT|nr:BatA domain-containing protein [Xanthocytophaga agilis]MDJ1499596.1 BatA domain-containing protein [Xanthocytophaga agilis]